jgi:cytochrome c oxidase subunit 2
MLPLADWISRVSTLPLFAQGAKQSFWLPEQASTFGPAVDNAFYFILNVSIFFFCLIVVLMIAFVLLYRRRPNVESKKSANHSTLLEIVWTLIPVAIVVVIFYQGFKAYTEMRIVPSQAYEINILARKWFWTFKYPNGYKDSAALYVPAGEPVRLVMTSDDVIHGLAIPDFRINMDVVPGRYTKIWFNAREPGNHQLYCTQYCGQGHSDMTARVVVLPRAEFDKKISDLKTESSNLPPAEAGKLIYQVKCVTCHNVDGTANTGPSFKGIWGKTEDFYNAPSQVVDENYIRESILEPSKKVVRGYSDKMQSFKGILSDEEIVQIIEYIKSLK